MRIPHRLRTLVERHRPLVNAALGAAAIAGTVFLAGAVWFVSDVLKDLPSDADLRDVGTMSQATRLFDIHDRPVFTIYEEQRIEVPLDRVSPHLIHAVIDIEDQRFYEHGGIDLVRILGAAWTNLRSGRTAQGASTITQQLARQSFLTLDKTIRRKLKEMVVAVRLEREFSKDEILRLYLNKVYFGDGLYGVEAASRGYFGRHAADLDVGEAALLAGLVKSPSTYAPTVSQPRAIARRNIVLGAMRDAGSIDRGTYEAARGEPLHLADSLRAEERFGRYFKEEVRKQLVEQFGWERVYQGGLQVYTTLDMEMQKAADAEVARAVAEIERRQGKAAASASGNPLQAALIALDPHTGEVRAMVGGRDFAASAFNRATQARRQPGSAFKPLVYAAALEQGYTPATIIDGLNDPIVTAQGSWVPEDEHVESGSITMRAALRTSSNRAAVRMLEDVGIRTAVQYAKRLGIESVPSVPSLALGSGEVTLASITGAYGAFANGGLRPLPTLIRRVENVGGTRLFEGGKPAERAVSETTAFLMSSMLADVINSGTGWTARRTGFTLPAAGKTGTTNDYHDAWFIGYTPHLVTGVWVGYDQPRTIMRGGYAAELAVPLWARFMMQATRGDAPDWFSAPGGITSARICRISGKLATSACEGVPVAGEDGTVTVQSMAYTEYFASGTEPIESCTVHGHGSGGQTTTLATQGHVPGPASSSHPAAVGAVPHGGATVAGPQDPIGHPVAQGTQVEPKKKRGFWSRLLGIGRDDEADAGARDRKDSREGPAAPR